MSPTLCASALHGQQGGLSGTSSGATRSRKRPVREFIANYLREHPCVDCGETDILVLHFDHCRGRKVLNISIMVKNQHSLENIKKEITKCDVRCTNCHMRRTAIQFG